MKKGRVCGSNVFEVLKSLRFPIEMKRFEVNLGLPEFETFRVPPSCFELAACGTASLVKFYLMNFY